MSTGTSSDSRIGVDVGGTFTDVALLTGEGDLTTAKVPTTDDQSEGVIEGVLKACDRANVAPGDLATFAHAMTVGVNTLLERSGARTALVTTAGFRDVLEIGRQDRPDLYDLSVERPEPLVPRRRRFELEERTTVDGVETPVEETAVRDLAADVADADAESVAVALLHAYADPENERRAARILREELDVPVTASHEVLAEFREYERTATTVADAYVTPEIDDYLGRLIDHCRTRDVPVPRVMQSNGGTATADAVRSHAISTVLSGPAAGVVGARRVARSVGRERDADGVITFDMGGTSTDVSVVRRGTIQRTADTEIAGTPIRIPVVDVETIGAGGGSIAHVDAGGALRVGPQSAGASPGPACYGRGGQRPTVTDALLVLGYLGEDTTLGGEVSLDAAAAREVLAEVAEDATLGGVAENATRGATTENGDLDPTLAVAHGVYDVAIAQMTRAIRSVTVERGYDPRTFDLVAFGGAGPAHAARLAENLDVGAVAIPRPCGVLSAYGLLAADEKHDAVRTHLTRLSSIDPETVEGIFSDLVDQTLADVAGDVDVDVDVDGDVDVAGDGDVDVDWDGDDRDRATIERSADLRYAGQSFELTVPVGERFDPDATRERFLAAHDREYGYRVEEPVELVSLRVTATVERTVPDLSDTESDRDRCDDAVGARRDTRTAYFDGDPHETAVYDRSRLAPNDTVDGPAVLEQAESTTVIPPDWQGEVRTDGTVLLTQT